MTYYVGVEGIGSRFSVAVVADADGTILAAHRSEETLNLHTIEPEGLGNRFKTLLQDLFAKAKCDVEKAIRETRACVGMSGVTFSYERLVELRKIIDDGTGWTFGNGERLACTGDAEITFFSHALTDTGSLVISHTGSVAYMVGRKKDGKLGHYRYGGWGPQLGDEGSGYWLGREALRAICREHAEGAKKSDLWLSVKSWLEDPISKQRLAWDRGSGYWKIVSKRFIEETQNYPDMDPRTLVYRFAHRSALELKDDQYRHAITALVIPLMTAYRMGDEEAKKIVSDAVGHLVEQHDNVRRIAERGGLTAVEPIVLYGGVFAHNPELVESFHERMSKKEDRPVKTITIKSPGTMRPVMGALLFALGESEPGTLRIPERPIIDAVRAQLGRADFRWQRELAND
jgi:N-acetylglucosamine kinase-like BadF-type ATPase